MKFLQDHPFAVEAFFQNSRVLTFAVPKAQLEGMIPECLELDTFQEKWAFIAVAMVQTNDLRPKGFPRFMGHDFLLIGYRIFVRYTNNAGKRLRGLYILKSETDKKKMEFLGNIFTHYRYTTIDIQHVFMEDRIMVKSQKSGFEVVMDFGEMHVSLPQESPFTDWKDARKFSGPLPFTFSWDPVDRTVLIVEGVRKNWKPYPIKIERYHFDFLDELNLKGVVLASAFGVSKVPYYWKKGRKEKWH